MQAWRRCFATSARRLNSHPTRPRPLRCAQIFADSKPTPDGGASSLENQEIQVQGFVRSVRKQKRVAFAEISDGSTIQPLQAILTPEQAADLTTGAAVQVSGSWKACPPGKEQTHELQTTDVKVVGSADPETYPIQKKYHTPDFLRQIPHLRLRTPFNSLLSRFRSECIFQLASIFRARAEGSYTQVQPPLITSSDCEGAGEVFTITPRDATAAGKPGDHFFRSPKYLTVSSQLHLEAYAAELGNVWTLSPTFRAEKSDTPRHLSEFYMLEAEMNFMSDLESLTGVVESVIRQLTENLYNSPVGQEVLSAKRTGEAAQDELDTNLQQRWMGIMKGDRWPRISYTDAIKVLEEATMSDSVSFKHPPSWTGGLQLEHERFIVDTVGKGSPVFVTDYPKAVKPFYMAPSATTDGNNSTNETVACFDLLMPDISEVAGGSIREHRLPSIIENMRHHGLIGKIPPAADGKPPSTPSYPHLLPNEDLGNLQWYADLRRWGTAPSGGFGLGFDRFIGYLVGVSSVRDIVAFPRYFGKADC
ncbi:asparaginyl-tRNA synthetase [Arachnomyces sp. PD_36]|nr:asparaginyl-tRNA synthetase [Arachnomyces sp. PD_36]